MEQSDVRRSAGAAAVIVILLGLAVGGGALFAGSGTSATPDSAWPFALVGALLGVIAVAVGVALVRSLFPASWSAVRSALLVTAVLALALGALLGAGFAPDDEMTDEISDPDAPPEASEPNAPEAGEDRVGEGDRDAGSGSAGAPIGSEASVVGVDADGDGVVDVDADGRRILGVDQNGDGLVDAVLIPCPGDSVVDPPTPGTVTLDQNCDGTVDFELRFDDGSLLGASPQIAAQLERLGSLGRGLDELGGVGGDLDGLDETDLTVDDLEDLGFDVEQNPDPVDQDDPRDDDQSSFPWGALIGLLFIGLLALAAIAAMCSLAIVFVRGRSRQASTADASLDVPLADDDEPVDLGSAIASSLDTLEHDLDPRAGICAAYGTLLERLAESGLARRPEEAPEEHMRRCLDGASLPERPVRELLDLFTIARFSTHPVTERHRQAAVAAMREVLAATTASHVAPPALAGAPAGWAPPTGPNR